MVHDARAGPGGCVARAYQQRVARAEKVLMSTPEVESVFSIGGFSFAGNASNTGMIFSLLKPLRNGRAPSTTQGCCRGCRARYSGSRAPW